MPSTTPSNLTLPPLPTTHLKPRTTMPLPQPLRCIKPLPTMKSTAATNFTTHKPSAGVRTAIPKSLREPFKLAQDIHNNPHPISRHIYIFLFLLLYIYPLQTLPSQPSKATKQAKTTFFTSSFLFPVTFFFFFSQLFAPSTSFTPQFNAGLLLHVLLTPSSPSTPLN